MGTYRSPDIGANPDQGSSRRDEGALAAGGAPGSPRRVAGVAGVAVDWVPAPEALQRLREVGGAEGDGSEGLHRGHDGTVLLGNFVEPAGESEGLSITFKTILLLHEIWFMWDRLCGTISKFWGI